MEKFGMKLWVSFYGFLSPSHSHPAVFAMHGGLPTWKIIHISSFPTWKVFRIKAALIMVDKHWRRAVWGMLECVGINGRLRGSTQTRSKLLRCSENLLMLEQRAEWRIVGWGFTRNYDFTYKFWYLQAGGRENIIEDAVIGNHIVLKANVDSIK